MAKTKSLIETVKEMSSAVVPEIKEKIVQKVIEKKVFNTSLFGRTAYDIFDVLKNKMVTRIVAEVCTRYKLHDEIKKEIIKIVELELVSGRELLVDSIIRVLTNDVKKSETTSDEKQA
jgi:hypothetical protein